MKPVHSDPSFPAAGRNTRKVLDLILFLTFTLNPQIISALIKAAIYVVSQVTGEETVYPRDHARGLPAGGAVLRWGVQEPST